MSDPKSKVQIAIERLGKLKGYLDAEIAEYQQAQERIDDGYRVAENTAKRDVAKNEIKTQLARIDSIIMSDEVKELIGSAEVGDPEKLNEVIAEILKRVETVKDMKIAGITTDTKTGKTVEEIEKLKKLDPYLTSMDYDSLTVAELDSKIEELKAKVASEEEIKKYDAAKKEIGDAKTPPVDPKDVNMSVEYDAFITEFEEKLSEYEKQKQAEGFNTKPFKHVVSRKSLDSNAKAVKSLIDLQKTMNGEKEIDTPSGKKKIKDLKFDDLRKMGDADIKKIVGELTALSMGSKAKTEAKAKDLKDFLANSPVMKLFEEDKAKMEAFLAASPLNATELRKMIAELRKLDGKNYETIDRYEDTDPQVAVSIRKEIARLTELRDKMKGLEEAEAKTFEAEDITKVNINGVEVEIKKDSAKGKKIDDRVVDLDKDSDEMSLVVTRTYRDLFKNKKDAFTELENQVIEESKTGERLPRDFGIFSRIAAMLRGEKETRREQAISERVQAKIKKQIETEQASSRGEATGRKNHAVETAKEARTNAFELDAETRAKVNKNAYEAARRAIINDGKKAEEAYRDAGRDEEK